ncbi:MAG: helix-turn-helix transcriptional regulator [Myxococcota bacterium]
MHRDALCCAAVLLRTSEEHLRRLVDEARAGELFAWLESLPFARRDVDGLYLVDEARAELDADLRWRRPAWRRALLARVAAYYLEVIEQAPGLRLAAIRAVWFAWREELRYFEPDMLHAWVSSLRRGDEPVLEAIVSRHFGPESLAAFQHWVGHRAASVMITRDPSGDPRGLALYLALGDIGADDARRDPGVAALHEALGPSGRAGVKYLRFFLDREHGQQASPTAAAISAYSMERAISTPGLTNVYSAWTPPSIGQGVLGQGAQERVAGCNFTIDGRAFGTYRKTVDGRRMVDWFIARYIAPLARAPDASAPKLSPRQRQTLEQLVRGKSEKEVAAALGLSLHTVHQYVKSLYRLYGVGTRAALVARVLGGQG